MVRVAATTLLFLSALSLTTPALAQQPVTQKGPEGEIAVLADQIERVGEDGILIATGNVEITRGTSRLTADRVEYNQKTGEALAVGRVIFFDGQDRLVGDRIDYNFKSGTGVVHNASAFSEPYYRLKGAQMERIGERLYRVHKGVFTTCEADPPDWSVRFRRATADLDDLVVGRDASFWVHRIPLIPWIPFFAAAIRRERQTGFLFPELGSSSSKGFFAKIPFFWAISDSQDLTLSLDTFADKGVGMSAGYRYVLSEAQRGSIGGFFIRETFEEDDDRGNGTWRHRWQITPRLSFTANVNGVSDDKFFRTYGDRLDERSLERAESNLFLSWRSESWSFVGTAFWYQDLTTQRPFELQRLPELRLQNVRQPVPGVPGLLYQVESSFVNFVRDVGADGRRVDFHPQVFLPIPVAGLFTVTPFLGGRATFYDAVVVGKRTTRSGKLGREDERVEIEVTRDAARTRLLGEYGADIETRVSRIYDVNGTGGIARLQHLIEPRVNITQIRGISEKRIPQFDTGGGTALPTGLPLADIGIDALGDTSRVTYSLTNRLNAKTAAKPGQEAARWELLRFVLSQSVDIPPVEPEERFSDVRGDLIVQPSQFFYFRSDATYNVSGKGIQTVNADISASAPDLSATTGIRFSEPEDITFVRGELRTKVSRYVDFRASTNWDVRSGAVVESRFGTDIRLQCWALRLEYIDRHKNEDEFRFSVNLLGLGGIGSRAAVGTSQTR